MGDGSKPPQDRVFDISGAEPLDSAAAMVVWQ